MNERRACLTEICRPLRHAAGQLVGGRVSSHRKCVRSTGGEAKKANASAQSGFECLAQPPKTLCERGQEEEESA